MPAHLPEKPFALVSERLFYYEARTAENAARTAGPGAETQGTLQAETPLPEHGPRIGIGGTPRQEAVRGFRVL